MDRPTWDDAQHIGAAHGTSRDTDDEVVPAVNRTYAYRAASSSVTAAAA